MKFDKQPILKGEQVTLRPMETKDYEALFEIASDIKIWDQHPSWNRYKKQVFKKLFRESMESGGCLVIIDNVTGKIIGSSRYHGYDESSSEIEIGWTFIARNYWGGSVNREIKGLMLKHAFQFIDHAVFLVGPENFRSRRAMEKIGGKVVELRVDGNGTECLVYRINAQDDWFDNLNKYRD